MSRFLQWWDRRLGWRNVIQAVGGLRIPDDCPWRKAWTSALVFLFFIQVFTGFCLWLVYSPNVRAAWESIFYLDHDIPGGRLVHAIHYFTSDVLILLLVGHLAQLIWFRLCRPPRELPFWLAGGLLILTLGAAATGHLLPWDQHGFWSTKIRLEIMGGVPGVGTVIKRLQAGGTEMGQYTLTRFMALHAGLLPAFLLLGWVLLARAYYQLDPRQEPPPSTSPGPAATHGNRLLLHGVAWLVAMAVVFAWMRCFNLSDDAASPWQTPMSAPADPGQPYSGARPEWYFLFLFQLLQFFKGENQVWGSLIIPGLVGVLIFLMPWTAASRIGHRWNQAFILALLVGWAALTLTAVYNDARDPHLQNSQTLADEEYRRAVELARAPAGIPVQGVRHLLDEDPKTQGPKLFADHCASCHRYGGTDARGNTPSDPPAAPDLKGFATPAWLAGLLDPDRIATPEYFGNTAHVDGKMAKFVQEDVARFDAEKQAALRQTLLAIALHAGLANRTFDTPTARETAIQNGEHHLVQTLGCVDCHEFQIEDSEASAPKLTRYGSRDWIIQMISDPEHPKFYGERNDGMPRFGVEGILTPKQIALLAEWLRGEWYRP